MRVMVAASHVIDIGMTNNLERDFEHKTIVIEVFQGSTSVIGCLLRIV